MDKIKQYYMETLTFKTPQEFRKWLTKNYEREEGIWVRFFNKGSGVNSMTYMEALDEALCFGWIDGQVKKDAPESRVARFTHRRKGSVWSKRNVDNVERLKKEGKMMPSGLKEVEEAKKDGRWEIAYGSQVDFELPADFLSEVNKNKKTKEFLEKLNKGNKYAIYWRLQTAKKPEVRERRMKKILEMLSNGKSLY